MSERALTTLELARQIGTAVVHQVLNGPQEDAEQIATQAVINTLHETGYWFCRLEDTPLETVITALPQLPFDEPEKSTSGGR